MLTYLDTAIGFVVVMLAISLLITIATQVVSALLNHRGGNLLWGLQTLFKNIDPGLTSLKDGSDWLAQHVLTHCLISDSWFSNNPFGKLLAKLPLLGKMVDRFQLASAIRSGELVSILHHVAAALPTMDPPPPANQVAKPAQLAADIKTLLNAANQTAQREIQLVTSAVAGAGFGQAAPAAPAPAPGAPATPAPALASIKEAAVPLLEDAVSTALTSAGRLEAWFGSMMDRVSQRFAMWMRIWTVVFGAGFAFIIGLNSIWLANTIYQNASLRDSLVGTAQQVSTIAGNVLDPQNSLSAKYSASLLDALSKNGVTAPNPAPVIQTTAAGTTWINTGNNVPADKRQAVLQEFDTQTEAATRKFIADNSATAKDLTSKLDLTLLRNHWTHDFPHGSIKAQIVYILGVLLTAALLSLGAPFWFNSLKSLTNLRPIVASKEKQEQQTAA